MLIPLRSWRRKLGFAGLCLLFASLYLNWATRAYLASEYAKDMRRPSLEKAVRLEPHNAEHRHLLGRYLFFAENQVDPAIGHFQTAVALNPRRAAYWLDLAMIYHANGNVTEQRRALQEAIRREPTKPAVAWEAANFYLIQGDHASALRLFRVVLTHEPESVDAALALCWRATGDANLLLRDALPPRADVYVAFLRLLADKNEPAATLVWNRLLMLQQPFPPQSVFPYLDYLMRQRSWDQAYRAWQDLVTIHPTLASYVTPKTLVVNGSFEEPLLNGGFDWRYRSNPHVSVSVDSTEFHHGTRSLVLTFDGESAGDPGVLQFVPVQPNAEYELRASLKTEEIVSSSGPRLAIYDAAGGALLLLTADRIGTSVWKSDTGHFRTPPDTSLVVVKVDRVPGVSRIKGKVWLDNVMLERQP